MSDLTTQLAKAMFASNAGPGWGGVSKSVREIYIRTADTVIAHLTAAGRLIPAGGMALTAERIADSIKHAPSPNEGDYNDGYVAALTDLRDALFPATEPAEEEMKAEAVRTRTPAHHNPETGRTTITVQRSCNRCGRDLGDATEKELDACVNGTPLPDVHDECGCDASLVAPAEEDTKAVRTDHRTRPSMPSNPRPSK